MPREKSRLLRTITKNEDQTMDQNNRLQAKTSKRGARITITMDWRQIPSLLIRVFLQAQTSHMGTTIPTMEDDMINAQMSHSIEAMEIGLEMALHDNRR